MGNENNDTKITFKDMIALAKSGWTPQSVNEMIEKFDSMNISNSSVNPSAVPEDDKAGDESPAETSSEETLEDNSEDNSEDKTKIIELEKKIADLEKKNSQKPISSEKKSLDDMVDDIFKEYFN